MIPYPKVCLLQQHSEAASALADGGRLVVEACIVLALLFGELPKHSVAGRYHTKHLVVGVDEVGLGRLGVRQRGGALVDG